MSDDGNWPHQFTKNGKEELEAIDDNGMKNYIKHVTMRCVHCGKHYRLNEEPIPPNPCPARNDKREMSRIRPKR